MCFVRLVLGSGGALLAAVISLGGEKKEEKERGAGGMKGKLVVDGPEGAELPTCELWRAALERSGVVLQCGAQNRPWGCAELPGVGHGGTWQR